MRKSESAAGNGNYKDGDAYACVSMIESKIYKEKNTNDFAPAKAIRYPKPARVTPD